MHLAEAVIVAVLREAESGLAPFADANGQVVFEVTAHVTTAEKR